MPIYLKIEEDILQKNADKLTAAAVDFFLKIDSDFIKIDNDFLKIDNVLGAPNSTGLSLAPPEVMKDVTAQIGDLTTEAASVSLNFTKIIVNRAADAVDAYLQMEHIKYKLDATASEFALQFVKIEQDLIDGDPTDLGDVSNPGNTVSPGPVSTLATDLTGLATDATPQASRAVDAFLELEGVFIKGETQFLKLEDEILQKYHGHLPPAFVDYLLQLDNAYLKLGADFIKIDLALTGAGTTGGGAAVVGNASQFPPDVTTEIAKFWIPSLQANGADLTADIKLLKLPASAAGAVIASPTVKSTATFDAFMKIKLEEMELSDAITGLELDSHFMKVEQAFLDGDPDRPLITGLTKDIQAVIKLSPIGDFKKL